MSDKAYRIYYNQQGKPAASLHGNVLRKRVKATLHQLRRPPAWAVDVAILEAARQDGAVRVEIEDTESGRIFIADIRLFDLYGFRFDRGFGVQIGLPLCYWRVDALEARQLSFLEV